MADVPSDPDASTFSHPWFEQIGTSGFAAVGAILGFAISLLFVLNTSPAAPALPAQRIVAPAWAASELAPQPKSALPVTRSPTQGVTQSPQPLSAPVQQASAPQAAPDQDAAPDGTQVASTPEQSPPASQQDAPDSGAPLAPASGSGENTRSRRHPSGMTRALAPASGSGENRVHSSDTLQATTATGNPLHVGPRGGVYHMSKSGKKVYERKRR